MPCIAGPAAQSSWKGLPLFRSVQRYASLLGNGSCWRCPCQLWQEHANVRL